MSAVPVVPHVSWLKKAFHTIGVILGIVAKDVKPVADIAVPVLETLFPQFAGPIQAIDNVLNKVVLEVVKVETLAASAGQASGTGPQKLAQVLASPDLNAVIDGWVAAKFPGAPQLDAATKAGLVNAVVGILNQVQPPVSIPVS